MKPAKGINWKAERVKGNCRGRESATRIGRDEVDDACNGQRWEKKGGKEKRKTKMKVRATMETGFAEEGGFRPRMEIT